MAATSKVPIPLLLEEALRKYNPLLEGAGADLDAEVFRAWQRAPARARAHLAFLYAETIEALGFCLDGSRAAELAPIRPAALPPIACTLQELKRHAAAWDAFRAYAAQLPDARARTAWALSAAPAAWQDQERAELAGVHPKTFSRLKRAL